MSPSDSLLWEGYVRNLPGATFAHLPQVSQAFEKAYGLKTFTLAAFRTNNPRQQFPPEQHDDGSHLVGLLPMVHFKHFLFGNELVSMPFLDTGGVLATDDEARDALIKAALQFASTKGIQKIEFRHSADARSFGQNAAAGYPHHEMEKAVNPYTHYTLSHKVRMILELPESSDKLMSSLKSKIRSQIRKPVREGLTFQVGGMELLDPFYRIFCINMRDLGSPVHSKFFFKTLLQTLSETFRIFIVYQQDKPLAASIVAAFGNCLFNPWASSLKNYKKLNANMLLYWQMLDYACSNHFKFFDFGRSTPGEGTFKFKAQWGAVPHPLAWSVYALRAPISTIPANEADRFAFAIKCWKRLPVGFSRWVGPKIRKHISL